MTDIYRIRMISGLLALAMMMIFSAWIVACGGDGDDGGSDVEGTPATSQSPPGTVPAETTPVYCNDEAIGMTVDQWATSVTLFVAEEPTLTFSDEEGFREDIEAATREFCAAGVVPPPEAVRAYCTDIVAAIEPRLDGPEDTRQTFLTEYYDSCDAT